MIKKIDQGHTLTMKKWYIIAALMLSMICTVLTAIKNDHTIKTVQKEIAGEVLRFHVRANSDSKEDQKIKMQVKEAVITYLNPIMDQIRNVEEARILIENQLTEVEKIIHDQLNKNGCRYGFQIKITQEHFPRRTYGDCTFPEGVYEAVIISLGKGEGQNWWCMIYPGLCFFNETYAVVEKEKKEELSEVLTEESYTWVTDREHIRIKFRIQWLNELFGIDDEPLEE